MDCYRSNDGYVEIIFFSTPTPAASAPSYSSGTAPVLQRDPVESNTVTWSSDSRPPVAADHLDLAGDVVLGDRAFARGRR